MCARPVRRVRTDTHFTFVQSENIKFYAWTTLWAGGRARNVRAIRRMSSMCDIRLRNADSMDVRRRRRQRADAMPLEGQKEYTYIRKYNVIFSRPYACW